MKCNKAQKLIIKTLDEKETNKKLEQHIRKCNKCLEFKNQMLIIQKELSNLPTPELSPYLLNKIKNEIRTGRKYSNNPLLKYSLATAVTIILFFSGIMGFKLGENTYYAYQEELIYSEVNSIEAEMDLLSEY